MSTSVLKSKLKSGILGIVILGITPSTVWGDATDDIVRAGLARGQAAVASQKRIDGLSEETEKIVSKYHQQRKSVEVLKKFNDRLRRTLAAQETAMAKLERSIEDASLIERQIVPLMLRFRQVLDAYSTESNYGKTIDVYTEELNLDGASKTVNILQVGRAGLYYQTIDGVESGYWDKSDKQWKSLDASHNEGITNAIRISQGKASKDLMTLPIAAPEKI